MAFNLEEVKDDPGFKDFVSTAVASAVDEATSGLKAKNAEILDEKKRIEKSLKALDGLDVEKARKAMEFLEKNADSQLVAEGKFDEVIERRLEKSRAEWEERINTLSTERDTLTSERDRYRTQFETTQINLELRQAATKAGILPEAIDDLLLRARGTFFLGEDGKVEARDRDGKLLKIDDKLVTADSWVASLPRHYWPASEGGGVGGGKEKSQLEVQLEAAAKSGDMATYRKLREKAKK